MISHIQAVTLNKTDRILQSVIKAKRSDSEGWISQERIVTSKLVGIIGNKQELQKSSYYIHSWTSKTFSFQHKTKIFKSSKIYISDEDLWGITNVQTELC